MKTIRDTRFFWFLKNLFVFFRCDLFKEIEELKNQQQRHQRQLDMLNIYRVMLELRDKILLEARENETYSKKYQKEIEYIQDFNMVSVFPYKQLKKVLDCVVATDDIYNMPYVIHNNKKLYFPKTYTEDMAKVTYVNFIENENILGGNYREKSPHQYQSDFTKIEQGDVLVDIGCAEGLLAIDVIEKVKKVYLIESDSNWIPALKATFESYKDKVTIINKVVSNIDTEETVKLETILQSETDETPVFIKMDIEGAETIVLESSREFFKKSDNVKISCCTYHKQNDEQVIKTFFESVNYNIEFSDGYMLFVFDNLQYPYFRKGIIRAKR